MSVDFKGKKVILYGESLWCRGFYDKFSDYFNIDKIVYTESESDAEAIYEGVGVSVLQQKAYHFEEYNDFMFIVCAGNGKKEVHDEFMYSMGYTYGKDYVDSMFAEYYYIHKIRNNMKNKDIWIFGAGNNGKAFYTEHCKELNIVGFISNYSEEKLCLDLPVSRPEDIVEKENTFIIICSEAETQMSSQLLDIGLVAGKNFTVPRWLQKKLLVGWGSCQVYSIYDMLLKNPSFEKEYDRIFVFDSRLQECNHADKQRIYTYGQVCDVLFYNSEGMLDGNKAIVDRFYKGAVVHSIPFYCFRGQLMQATEDCSKYSVRYENIKSHFAYWFIGDEEIEKLLEQGKTKEEILKTVVKIDYWSKEEIEKKWILEKRRVALLDKLSSLKVSGFLNEHYKELIVFKDGIHFCKELCVELSNQLAKLLDVEEMDSDFSKKVIEACSAEEKNTLPIYPAVLQTLEMDEQYKDIKYTFVHSNGDTEKLSFDEYTERYIDYVCNIKNIELGCGTRII